jgi:hypothetical protein
MSRTMVSSLPCAMLVGLLTVGVAGVAGAPSGAVATASAGQFVGFIENGTKIWRGIPYGEPPVGDLRWMVTVPKAKLQKPLETKNFGADCAQLGPAWPTLGGTGGKGAPCQNPMMGCTYSSIIHHTE